MVKGKVEGATESKSIRRMEPEDKDFRKRRAA